MIEIREYQRGDLGRIFGREYERSLAELTPNRDFERDLYGSPAFVAWERDGINSGSDGINSVPTPVFAGGVIILWPGVGEGWLHLSKWFELHPFSAFKIVRAQMHRIIDDYGLRRVQAPIHSAMPANIRLVKHLGFSEEGTLRRWGPDGADYVLFSLIVEESKYVRRDGRLLTSQDLYSAAAKIIQTGNI